MSAMENRSDGDREGTGAIAALPALITAIAARVPSDILAFAIRANRMPAPTRLFEVVNGLFVCVEGLKKFEDVHGCTVSFDAPTIPQS
jgi:hypothetical protein